jgi:uncharacterized protein (DUF1330 family)
VPAYLIADIDVHDDDAFARYKELAPASVEPYGGRFVAGGDAPFVHFLEGDWVPTRLVVLEFDSIELARRWYESDEYREARELRQSCSTGRVVLVDGVSG